ncbi:hypothetical protein L3Q82_004520 [Scortum barcoo]|uniref:Uncharacterized protein n=1 Tax=Scortum barcoo TaxID=214431 RepID=A0ACB8VGP4_9TELE|nr:hypothetical protein L3Q82_004520 [Scortum barcoo]
MLACGTPDAVDRYRQAKQAAARTVLEAKTQVWEEFGEAMEEDYRSGLEDILSRQTVSEGGKQYSANTVYSAGCLRVYGSLPNQSTCALWIWRRHSTVSLVVFCGECSASMGSGAFAKGCSVPVRPEQELGSSHCRQCSQGPEGVRFGNHRISSLLFADDVVLMASSGQDLQHVLERFAAECEAAGMRISTSKSEAMVLDRKRVACPLQVGGEVLPQVEEFKYLGVLFTSEGKMERELDRRIGAASAVMRSVSW